MIAGKLVTPREKESLVTKRVPFGEPFQSAEFPPTHGLTESAESESSWRFVFSACVTRTCDESLACESSLPPGRERRLGHARPTHGSKLSRSLLNRASLVNNLVRSPEGTPLQSRVSSDELSGQSTRSQLRRSPRQDGTLNSQMAKWQCWTPGRGRSGRRGALCR